MIILKLCPFCGGEAEMSKEEDFLICKIEYPIIKCKKCHSRTAKCEDEKLAIETWNKRVK